MAITLKDIAKRANVSQATVSRIINNKADGQVSAEVAERVKAAASALKYRSNQIVHKLDNILPDNSPARASRKIVMLIPTDNSHGEGNSFFEDAFAGALNAAGANGWRLEFCPVTLNNNPLNVDWEHLNNLEPDCRILAVSPWYMVILSELSRRGFRIAMIQGEEFWRNMYAPLTRNWMVFTYCNRRAAAVATDYLLKQGCRKIAVAAISQYMNEPEYPRVNGYLDALREHGNTNVRIIPVALRADNRAVILEAYRQESFDGLIMSGGDFLPELPESVKIVIDRQARPQYAAGVEAFLYYPMRQIGFDATAALMSDDYKPEEILFECPLKTFN